MSCDNVNDSSDEDLISKEALQVEENAYETINFSGRRKNILINTPSNKKPLVVMCLVLAFTLVLSVSIGCIAFPLETHKLTRSTSSLQNEVELLKKVVMSQNKSLGLLLDHIASLKQEFSSGYNTLDNNVTSLKQEYNSSLGQLFDAMGSLQQEFMSQNNTLQVLSDNIGTLGQYATFPIASCADVLHSYPSGYYWVRASNGSAVREYCEVTRSCGGVTGGWTRVAKLDMTNSSYSCPSGFRQRSDSNIRSCVIASSYYYAGCTSTYFTTNNRYSKVCGKVTAYQFGTTNAFGTTSNDINSVYVDGVSLTHGSPRRHIWTFAAALDETSTSSASSYCPCINGTDQIRRISPPSFVGQDYFCDTGGQYVFVERSYRVDYVMLRGARHLRAMSTSRRIASVICRHVQQLSCVVRWRFQP